MQKITPNTTAPAEGDARFWDRTARKYAKDPIGDPAGYERTLARTRELLAADDSVLEIGCGTGTTALHLAPFVRTITGTDISPEMIAIAREKLAERGLGNAEFTAARCTALPFAPASFDAILGMNILHLTGALEATLGQVFGLLKPSGRFISKTACLTEMNPLIRWVMIPVMRALGKAPAQIDCFTAEALIQALTAAGFVVEHVEYHGTKGKDTRPFIVARKPRA